MVNSVKLLRSVYMSFQSYKGESWSPKRTWNRERGSDLGDLLVGIVRHLYMSGVVAEPVEVTLISVEE